MNNQPSKTLTKFLPILGWLPRYRKSYLPGDVSAGLTVGIMLIPQGMAYAMLAGLEPIHGLYAVTGPLVLYAIFGTSRQLAVGPDAIISLLTAAGIASLKASNAEEYLLYVLTLTFMIGLIRLVMGLLKLGFVVNFLSLPVIKGFTSGAVVLITLSQLQHWFRIKLPSTGHVQDMLVALVNHAPDIHWLSFGLGALGIFAIIFSRKIHPFFPSQLLAVIIGTVLVWGFDLTAYGVSIVGEVAGGLPVLSVPSFDLPLWRSLFPLALTIALVGYAQSVAIAKSIQSKHKETGLQSNQELNALGIANIGAAFFSGLPVAGGFSRSAVNDTAGARTPLSSIISALVILFTLLFITDWFYYLPLTILAAVILVAIAGLLDLKGARNLWEKDKSDFAMWAATLVLTMTLGIEAGILLGMTLSLLMVIYKASRPHMAQLGKVPGTAIYRNIQRFDNLEIREDLLIVRLDGPIYFANVDYIKDTFDSWLQEKESKIKFIVFNMESVTSLDSTGAHAMADWITDWNKEGIKLYITGTKGPVRDVLMRWGLTDKIGVDRIFMDDKTALEALENLSDSEALKKHSSYATQYNPQKRSKPQDGPEG